MREQTLMMGKEKLAVDLDDLTVKQTEKFRKEVGKILYAHEPLVRAAKLVEKYPRETVQEEVEGEAVEREETEEEWRQRISELEVKTTYARLDGESDEAYEDRMFELNMADHPSRIALEIVQCLFKVLGKPVPTLEQLQEVSNTALGEFVFELLFYHNIPGAEMFRAPALPERADKGKKGKAILL
jgi:hypothetical protein